MGDGSSAEVGMGLSKFSQGRELREDDEYVV